MDFTLAGLGVGALTLGITNGVKSLFGVDGKANQVVAVVTGLVLTSLAYGVTEGLIPADVVPYINWVVTSLGGGLSAIGVFDFVKSDLLGK